MTRATNTGSIIFSIGHSTHTIEDFVQLLHQHGITSVADVRSVPFSRFQPQYNKEVLEKLLKSRGIAYVFLGKELGARSDDRTCYKNGRVQYRLLAQTPAFRFGLERLQTGSHSHRIAIMCSEGEPLDCHRTLLISRELDALGISVIHIHPDSHLESHSEANARLLRDLKIPELNLFRTQEELIDQAYTEREEQIAYVDKEMADDREKAFV